MVSYTGDIKERKRREGRLSLWWSTGTKKEKRVSFQRFPLYSLCPSGWGLAGDTKLCTDFVNIIQSPGEQKNRYRLEAMFWRSSSWWWWSGGKHLSWVWCVCCMLAVHCLGSSQSVPGPKIWFEFYLVSTDNTWPGCHLVCCPPQAHVLSCVVHGPDQSGCCHACVVWSVWSVVTNGNIHYSHA